MKKQPSRKNDTCKFYSIVFEIFLPNILKINPYNLELYRLKFGSFFRHSVYVLASVKVACVKVIVSNGVA